MEWNLDDAGGYIITAIDTTVVGLAHLGDRGRCESLDIR